MRIAIARSGRLGGDGISRVVECWARVLGRAGHDVLVLAEEGTATPPGFEGVGLELVPEVEGGRTRLFARARRSAERIAELTRDRGLDLVISHDSMLTVAIRAALPRIPLLGTFHSPLVDENRLTNWKYTDSPIRKLTYPGTWFLFRRVERQALESVSAAHTLSEFTWGRLSRRYPRACDAAVWRRIPGTFDDRSFVPAEDRRALRERMGFDPEDRVLLTVRRLVPRNGVDRIVRCAAALRDAFPRVRFLIGGSGELESDLRRQIEAADVGDSVRMLGFLGEQALVQHYQAADAFLLPTRDLECFGLPVIEAMACGLVPLVMPDGGPAEVCRDHPEWIAAANTGEAFTELVGRFLTGCLESDRDAVVRVARERYAEAAVGPRILELAEEMVSGSVVPSTAP